MARAIIKALVAVRDEEPSWKDIRIALVGMLEYSACACKNVETMKWRNSILNSTLALTLASPPAPGIWDQL